MKVRTLFTPLSVYGGWGWGRGVVLNIKIDLQEVGFEGAYWIELARDRDKWQVLVNAAMNIRVP